VARAQREGAARPHKKMVAEKIHRVIVVDERGAMVGIVTPMDVLRAAVQAEPRAPIEWVPLA
jgi:CBS-domain-containing membrane protein